MIGKHQKEGVRIRRLNGLGVPIVVLVVSPSCYDFILSVLIALYLQINIGTVSFFSTNIPFNCAAIYIYSQNL